MTEIRIKDVILENNVFLAPMAGVTDFAFRSICESFGASLTYTEMISAKALWYKDKKTKDIMYIDENEKNTALQIFGNDKDIIKQVIISDLNDNEKIKIIDLNFGCPAPKIVKNEDGSFLLKNPQKIYDIVYDAVKVSKKPVTAKIRMGFDSEHINFLEVGKAIELAGASMVTIHGRTREDFYSGISNVDAVRKLKEHLNIPVCGNGDIVDIESAKNMFEKTNCDAIMIGRGSLGNPFVFRQINSGKTEEKNIDEVIETIKKQYLLLTKHKSEDIAIKEMRKHVGWYIKGFKNSNLYKVRILKTLDLDEIFNILNEFREEVLMKN